MQWLRKFQSFKWCDVSHRRVKYYRFDRIELAGSLGDLGTLLPLVFALVSINGLNPTILFLLVGMFYIWTGLYYRLPISIQPLKLVAILAISLKLIPSVIAASGILIGLILLFLVSTRLIDKLSKLFCKPTLRGVQLGIGLLLIVKGGTLAISPKLFFDIAYLPREIQDLAGPIGLAIAFLTISIIFLFRRKERFPSALVAICMGIIFGLILKIVYSLSLPSLSDFKAPLFNLPAKKDFLDALILLVIPQIPITLGNAGYAASDLAKRFYGERAERVTPRRLSASMGLFNIISGLCGSMPVCHGSGGIAAHYRFGARTGGANIMLGAIFLAIALIFKDSASYVIALIPVPVLGVLLFFAGIEMLKLILDLEGKKEYCIAISIAAIALLTSNLTLAMACGIFTKFILHRTS